MGRFDNPETETLVFAYAKWRVAALKSEGSESLFGSNSMVSEISRDLREDAEIELRILIQDLKKENPNALKEWVHFERQTALDLDSTNDTFVREKRKQIARDWKFNRLGKLVFVRYPHPSQYWGSLLPILSETGIWEEEN